MSRLTDEAKKIQKDEIVSLWKSLGVKYARFEFDCGGDSMNDTTVFLFDENGESISDSVIEEYFYNETYSHVDFYVNSSGDYQGECGHVLIELETEEDFGENNFVYTKDAQSLYTEHHSDNLNLKLHDEDASLINKYIRGFVGNESGLDYVYKPDLFINDSDEIKLNKLKEFIDGSVCRFDFGINHSEGQVNEDYTFSTGEDGIVELTDNTIPIEIIYSVNVYKDSSW